MQSLYMAPQGPETELVRRWSTDDVARGRLEYFSAALSEAIVPMALDVDDAGSLRADISLARLDAVNLSRISIGTAHAVARGSRELAHTREHNFQLLMATNCTWQSEHRGRERMLPRDILVHDSSFPLDIDVQQPSLALNVAFSEHWLRRWVPNPGILVGKRIPAQSAWGAALCAYLGELSPELVEAPPLPLATLADQVGSLLALTVNSHLTQVIVPFTPGTRSLHARILDCLQQRCTEARLVATDIAVSLDISVRTLHRTLAAANQTFGDQLISARVRVAERMLTSALFSRLTSAEIGRRAGFQSASHFVRAVRKRHGRTPMQLRRGAR
jgi:AraC family transcriptional regulator, positive regulator of tynA and feaB